MQVKNVLNNGACSRDGRIHAGDRLVAIEGHYLPVGVSHSQCMRFLREHSSKEQVTLQVLRQSKQDDSETLNNNVGDLTHSESADCSLVQGKDGDFTADNDGDTDNVLSDIEIDQEFATKNSQVHHNQIFAQQHVKLAYARNSFRVKNNRQIPKVPTGEVLNRTDDKNSNKFSHSNNSIANNANTNSSDTEHESLTGLSRHQTVENVNNMDTLDGEELVDSKSSEGSSSREKNGEDSIGNPNIKQLFPQDMDVNKDYEGSSYIESSNLYISSESGYLGEETNSNVQPDNTEVKITRVKDYDIPKKYQRYEMTHRTQDISGNNYLAVIDSDLEMEGTDLLATAPNKVQELLATTPPNVSEIFSTGLPAEAPEPPPKFSTYVSYYEAPMLPCEGPSSVPSSVVPRSSSPQSIDGDGIERREIKLQGHEELSQTLNDKMKYLDQILNDDSLPVTNIDDLLDEDDNCLDYNIDTLVENAERKVNNVDQYGNHQVKGASSVEDLDNSNVLSPQTSADLKNALVNPFEQIERDFDNDEIGVSDLLTHDGWRVTEEGMNEELQSAPVSDMADRNGYDAEFSRNGNSYEEYGSAEFEVKGIEQAPNMDVLRTSDSVSMRHEAPVSLAPASDFEFQWKGLSAADPPLLGNPHVKVCESTAPLEQAQSTGSQLYVNTDDQQQKHSSSQHTSVFSSHTEESQFRELEHTFLGPIDSKAENVTVAKIISPSASLQHLTPEAFEDTARVQTNESTTEAEPREQPLQLTTTDIQHKLPVEISSNFLIDDLTSNTHHQSDSASGGIVCYHDDQDGTSSLGDVLDAGFSDVHQSSEKCFAVTADTVSTNNTLSPAYDTNESNYTLDHMYKDPESKIIPNTDTENNQVHCGEQLYLNKTTVTVVEQAPPTPNYSSHPGAGTSENSTKDNNSTFDSKMPYHFEQSLEFSNSNQNRKDKVIIHLDAPQSTNADKSSHEKMTTQFHTHAEESYSDANCTVDHPGPSINSFTQVISTVEMKDLNTGNNEVVVEVIPDDKCVTKSMYPAYGKEDEINSNPTCMYHTQLSSITKTTGDSRKANARSNNNSSDYITSHNTNSNQTVTDSMTHDRNKNLAKTVSECRDNTRGTFINLSSMNDVQFDISSSEQSCDIKSDCDTAIQNSTVDKEQLYSSKDTFQSPKSTSATFPVSSLKPLSGIYTSRNSETDNDANSRNTLPSLKLPKLSSFESRRLPQASPRPFNMKSSLKAPTFKSSSLPKNRNKRSEVEPFTVEVFKGLLGLGIKLNITKDGLVQVADIQKNGPVGRSAVIRLVLVILLNNKAMIHIYSINRKKTLY